MERNILFLPVGRKTFDLEAADKQRVKSLDYIKQISESVIHPNKIITSPDELKEFLSAIDRQSVFLIIYQSVTFADGEFIQEVTNQINAHVLVWSVREPSVGGRLRFNSLTGGNSTSHYLRSENHPFSFIYGNIEEAQVQKEIQKQLSVLHTIKKLQQLKIGLIGEHPPGFFFSDTNEKLLQEKIGATIVDFDLEKAFEESVKVPENEWIKMVDRAEKQVVGLKKSDETVKRFAQFSTHVEKEINKEEITALAIRCLPEFFSQLGAAACSTLSQFTEDGVVSACESDIHGSISMFILRELAKGEAPYLGDMVHVNEASNSAVFWHCGASAYSLAHPNTGPQAGVHPNRKLGFTMEFGLKPGVVTMFRLSYSKYDGYRLLILRGQALDTPQRFNGTSVEVELETEINNTLYSLMKQGFEPHYALVYSDVVEELVELGRQLNIDTTIFVK